MGMTFEEFQNSDSVSITLSDDRKRHIDNIVKNYANFELVADDQYSAMIQSDIGFQNDGTLQLELPASQTKAGTPFTYELDFHEHFIAQHDK